jgi:hypothetical protein
MPAALVRTLAEEKNISISEAENRWEKAKKITEEQAGISEADDGEAYRKYVVGVFKKSMGVKEEDKVLEGADNTPPVKVVFVTAKDNYPRLVQNALNFDDILNIFVRLFPYSINPDSWEKEYDAAKKAMALHDVFRAETDIEIKYEIAREIEGIARECRYNPGFKNMAGKAMKDAAIIELQSPALVGKYLFDRNCKDGEKLLNEAMPSFYENVNQIDELQKKIDVLHQQYNEELEETINQLAVDKEAARKACGLDVLTKKLYDMNKERNDWVYNNQKAQRDSGAGGWPKWSTEQNEYLKRYAEEYDKISSKVSDLQNAFIEPIGQKYREKMADLETKYMEGEIKGLEARKKEITDQAGKVVVAKILEVSPVTEEEADQWVKSQAISKTAKARLKKQGYDENAIRKDMAEFYRLTGGRIGKAFFDSKGDKRANAIHSRGLIYVDSRFTKKILFHEMAHLLEAEMKLEVMGETFRDTRAKKEKGLKSLKSITGNPGFRSDEVAYTDDFFDPYVGKVYRQASTEVLSMGLQMFSSPEDTIFLAKRDPQMFSLMVGFMRSKPTAREIAKKGIVQQAALNETSRQEIIDKFYASLAKKAKDDEFWKGKGDGLIVSIDGYGASRGKSKGTTVIYYYYPGDPKGPGMATHGMYFSNRQDARNFVFLYLLYVQKGIIVDPKTASTIGYKLELSVKQKLVPPELQDIEELPTFIEDLK